MSLMKIYLRLLMLLYDTNEGLLKIIIVRVVCHWKMFLKAYYCSCCMLLMKVNLNILLFVLYVTDEDVLKISTVRGVFHW
jgi:hypothetical protein